MTSELIPRRYPLLLVFSGPSGVGKDSVIRELKQRFPDMHFAVTATTRPPRPGEVPNKDYFFLSQAEYDALLDRDQLLAPADVHGYRYGAPVDDLRKAFEHGCDVLLKIDVQGAIALRRRIPQAIFIFLAPSSYEDLVARLKARHTESGSDLERRIRDAKFEMEQMPHYDYVVVNHDHDLAEAAQNVASIITAEQLKTRRQPIDLL